MRNTRLNIKNKTTKTSNFKKKKKKTERGGLGGVGKGKLWFGCIIIEKNLFSIKKNERSVTDKLKKKKPKYSNC